MKRGAWSLLAIDGVGGAISALLLGLGLWNAFPDQSEGAGSTRELAATIARGKAELSGLGGAIEEQRTLESRYQSALAAAGKLPGQTPQETHLRALSSLAAQNHLGVVRQLPLSPREYPGLMEQRFAYEVNGTMPDLARFFKAVETAPGWTDISFLKIEQGASDGDSKRRNALLTFSAFSLGATQPPAAATQGG